jgi:uncharacterized membrane protein
MVTSSTRSFAWKRDPARRSSTAFGRRSGRASPRGRRIRRLQRQEGGASRAPQFPLQRPLEPPAKTSPWAYGSPHGITFPQVRQDVEAIADLDRASERRVKRHQRLIEAITFHLGRPRTLYSLLVLVAAWVGVNTLLPGLRWDRPPFFWLQGLLALLSLTTTTVVLITQNRWVRRVERRSRVELPIILLAEEKIGKLVALLEEVRRALPSVRDRPDSQAEAMSRGTDVREVMDEVERSFDQEDRRAGRGKALEGDPWTGGVP